MSVQSISSVSGAALHPAPKSVKATPSKLAPVKFRAPEVAPNRANAVRPARKPRTKTAALAWHKKSLGPFLDLPFVSRSFDAHDQYWTVPATGGYMGGYETGEAMAKLFLKRLGSEDPKGHFNTSNMVTYISHSFAVRMASAGMFGMNSPLNSRHGSEFASLSGQHAGFFNTVTKCLLEYARGRVTSFAHETDQKLLDDANAGLAFDEGAYFSTLKS